MTVNILLPDRVKGSYDLEKRNVGGKVTKKRGVIALGCKYVDGLAVSE